MNLKQRIQRADTLTTGIVAGLLAPLLVYFILYFAKVRGIRFTLFSNRLIIGNLMPVIISHCILPNLLLFLVWMGLDCLKAAKGVLGATVALTVLLFLVKLIFSIL